ncbi:DNA-binding protein, partial [Pseudoflavonifractor phocaeensis]|uniref:hypothetical protein n=1 Tax=Pseudoflavonifractor phocaeensis TaxID=1870988 RepID=UPI001DE41B03|nr:DNA-binding protein [Pseudoflavonifractor phocaeensis]
MKHKLKTFLSALLAVAMLLSLLPAAVFAADNTGTFQKITAQDQLTDGQYVMVVDSGYAVGALDGTWLTATQLTDDNGAITDPAANLVWTVSVTADGVTLTDGNGVTVAPKGGNNNGIQSGAYTWAVTFANGAFRFLGVGEDTVTLASNKSSENKFRAYKNTTINAGYPCDFTLYKLEGEAEPAGPIAGGDQVVIYNPAYGKALSGTYKGFYNNGTDVSLTDGTLSGFSESDVWTVIDNGDGTWS